MRIKMMNTNRCPNIKIIAPTKEKFGKLHSYVHHILPMSRISGC